MATVGEAYNTKLRCSTMESKTSVRNTKPENQRSGMVLAQEVSTQMVTGYISV
jgi:hypothetical protein